MATEDPDASVEELDMVLGFDLNAVSEDDKAAILDAALRFIKQGADGYELETQEVNEGLMSKGILPDDPRYTEEAKKYVESWRTATRAALPKALACVLNEGVYELEDSVLDKAHTLP